MLNLVATIGAAYLIGTGTITSGAVVARGLIRATKTALGGDTREAVVEALGSVAAPAIVSFSTVTALCADIIGVGQELAEPVLDETELRSFNRVA